MELDDFKSAWQALDKQLQTHNTLQLALLKEHKLQHARSSLRPLFWGQWLQVLLGLAVLAIGVMTWTTNRGSGQVLAAGVSLHVYGVLAIALGSATMLLSRVDASAPVLAIQKKLARLRRTYVASGLLLGWSWWLLWVPLVICLGALTGVDPLTYWPAIVPWGLAVGVVGLLSTLALYAWIIRGHHPRHAADPLAATSIGRAQRILDEITCFERDLPAATPQQR